MNADEWKSINRALGIDSDDISLQQLCPSDLLDKDEDLLEQDSSPEVFEKLEVSIDDDEEYKELMKRLLSIKIYRVQLECRQMEVRLNLPPSKFTIDIYKT